MKEKDTIEKQIRDQLNNYQENVPADLWNMIDKEINPRSVSLWKRYSAVAAIALLCMVTSVMVYFTYYGTQEYIEKINNGTLISKSINLKTQQLEPNKTIIDSLNSMKNKIIACNNKIVKKTSYSDNDENNSNKNNYEDTILNDKIVTANEITTESNSNKNNSIKKKHEYILSNNKKRKERLSIGINSNAVPYSSSIMNDGYMHLSNALYNSKIMANELSEKNISKTNKELFSTLYQQKAYTKIKHKQPVTFGLSLNFLINNRWMFETGLDYTMLSSDLTSGSKASYYIEEQKLHYLGIPIQIGYNLWHNKPLSLYFLAGGEAEKCIAGKLKTYYNEKKEMTTSENIHINEIQFSLLGSIGMQYMISNKMSLYAEPGIRYFFKDGSDVLTIRKDHPLTFNIKFGLRFSFEK